MALSQHLGTIYEKDKAQIKIENTLWDAGHFAPPNGIFLKFFGPIFEKLCHFFSANFPKFPVYTKRFKIDNGNLVLKRQKKIGFLQLTPNFPNNIPDFIKS